MNRFILTLLAALLALTVAYVVASKIADALGNVSSALHVGTR